LPLVSFPFICLPIPFIHVVAFIIPCYLSFYLSHHAYSGTSASPFAFVFCLCASIHHHLLHVFFCSFLLLPFLFFRCSLVLVFTFYTHPSPPLLLLHLLRFSRSIHFDFLVIFLSSLTPSLPLPVLLLLELISETGYCSVT